MTWTLASDWLEHESALHQSPSSLTWPLICKSCHVLFHTIEKTLSQNVPLSVVDHRIMLFIAKSFKVHRSIQTFISKLSSCINVSLELSNHVDIFTLSFSPVDI